MKITKREVIKTTKGEIIVALYEDGSATVHVTPNVQSKATYSVIAKNMHCLLLSK